MPAKVYTVKAMVFPVVMYGCESWTIKKVEHQKMDAFTIVVLEKTLESPLDCKEIQPVISNGNQPWIFIGRTDAEVPIFWPPDAKSQLISEETLDAGKDWRQKEKRVTEDERWLDGITESMDMNLGKLQEMGRDRRPGLLQSMGSQRVGHDWATELNWNTNLDK